MPDLFSIRFMNGAVPEQTSASSRLCAQCGMCCNGVLFFGVKLQETESAKALLARGLKIKRKDSDLYNLQPCAAHSSGGCSIYNERPVRCREFACRQLLDFQNHKTSESESLAIIERARSLTEQVSRLLLLAGEERTGKAFTQRYALVFTPPLDPSPEAESIREQLRVAMLELEEFLTLHFRTSTHSA